MSVIDLITPDMLEKYGNPISTSDPEIRIMFFDKFINLMKENKLDGFKFEEKGPILSEITHDKERIMFFTSHKDIYEYEKFSLNLINWESYRQEFETLEELMDLKKRLTAKPFLCYSEIEATRDTHKQKNVKVEVTYIRLVACVYPNSPKVKEQIDKAFEYAENHFKNKKKFDLYLNIQVAFWEWYKDILLKITQDKYYISNASNPTSLIHVVMKAKGFLNAFKIGANHNFVVKDPKIEIASTPEDLLPANY